MSSGNLSRFPSTLSVQQFCTTTNAPTETETPTAPTHTNPTSTDDPTHTNPTSTDDPTHTNPTSTDAAEPAPADPGTAATGSSQTYSGKRKTYKQKKFEKFKSKKAQEAKTPTHPDQYAKPKRSATYVSRSVVKMKADTNEWNARVELAAAYRLLHKWGLNEGIDNHLTSRVVDGPKEKFLVIPYGLKWNEVKASDLLSVGQDQCILEGDGDLDPTGFNIHYCIHKARGSSAMAVFHTHQTYATALCCVNASQQVGSIARLEMCHQNSLRFFEAIAYDNTFNGLVMDTSEGNRIATALGDKRVLMLASHGPIVAAASVARAVDDIYFLERCAKLQVVAQSMGLPLRIISDEAARAVRMSVNTHGDAWAARNFAAHRRELDRTEPDYAQ